MPFDRRLLVFAAAAALAWPAYASLAARPQTDDAALDARARAIHESVITLDTHNDIEPQNFTPERNYTQRLDTQVNLPKMVEGGLDASFFVVYVGQTSEAQDPDAFKAAGYQRAYDRAIAKFDAIHRLTEQIAPDQIGLALTSDDVRRLHAEGKKVALIGVENGYPIGEDLSHIQEFYDRGARYLSLAHNGANQLSDSNTGEREGYRWGNGLSPLGRQAVAELNRVGIMIDVSHPSKGSMMQTIQLTQAPIIASHSSVRALCDVSRNMDDEQLMALKENGGVIQIVAYSSYIKTRKPDSAERTAALQALRTEFGLPEPAAGRGAGGPAAGRGGRGRGNALQAAVDALPADRRAQYDAKLKTIDATLPADPPADVKDFVDHIDYAVKMIGIDHVGISSDFDGGGGIVGWKDASETFNVTRELVRRGYTKAQIAQLWGGNLLRVMDEVQQIAVRLRAQG